MIDKIIDKDIILDEADHNYSLESDSSITFTSCTSFVKCFFEPFDRIGIANNLVAHHPKYMGMMPHELAQEWDHKAEEGTLVHNEIDEYIKHGKTPKTDKGNLAVSWLESYKNENHKLLSEVVIYSKELQLAGTIDLLVYDKTNNSFEIFDWKTSRKIEKNAFKNKKGITPATSKLMDCNFIHYSLQLSLYRYLLEEYYNVSVGKTTVVHLNGISTIPYESEYFKSEIEEMLKYDREILKKIAEEKLTKEYINPN
ncbi:MAG: PD-(D/E)XK nuclease family protein [Chlorobi bacterium]|nr:PD-(D/E)XK nuclease family protein [Chlorobiota bacterium]